MEQLAFGQADALDDMLPASLLLASFSPWGSPVQERSVPRAGAQLAGARTWQGQKNGVGDHAGSIAGIAEG